MASREAELPFVRPADWLRRLGWSTAGLGLEHSYGTEIAYSLRRRSVLQPGNSRRRDYLATILPLEGSFEREFPGQFAAE